MAGYACDIPHGMELADLGEILCASHFSPSPKCPIYPNSDAEMLLNQLGLAEYFPSKITLQDVMAVQDREYESKTDLCNIPWLILQKLVMLDHQGREDDLSKVVSTDKQQVKGKPVEKSKFDLFFAPKKTDDGSFNPLDVLVAIYACCDMALKQTLLQKMFMCRLAVPFVSPLLSDGSLSYSLWAMRGIIVDWKNSEGICKQVSVVDQPTEVVTFLKLGRPSFSKSNLLNYIISVQPHPTFWNRECPLGGKKKSIAKGLVEAQWYLPAGDKEDIFDNVTMFLNLRGDACEHEQQTKLLEKISNVVVCSLDTTDLGNSRVQETMKKIHDSSCKVVLLLIMKEPNQEDLQEKLQGYFDYVGDQHKHSTALISSWNSEMLPRTTEDLKTELRETLRDCLKGESGQSINKSSSDARTVGMVIDEDDQYCRAGEKLAQEVIRSMDNISTDKCKTEMLQLQGRYWNEWSKLLKEKQNVGGKGERTIHEASKINEKMTALRKDQLNVCDKLSPLMKSFLKNLVKVEDSPAAAFYLQWLKVYLDNKSREALPDLKNKYHEKWKELKRIEKSENVNSISSIEKMRVELRNLEKLLAEGWLGVEHLFREMAQIYEAVAMCKSESMKIAIDRLPRLAAKMLLQGHPVEIMDGDAANVPLTWVKAVFTNLEKQIGEKKRFLVTSVLGIQSSGKSTLLNTMFGLQFAVSAGRCTRGVFMQLIKVDKKRSDLPYDYIMVCDTEGLRALELGQLKYNNDNQLATFVIGLGDVTIFNIKGENMAEVSDILEIVVHAFLKMKQSKNNFMTHRTCFFIHQNVPAINAKAQMDQATKMLQEKLDKMTREVCNEENIIDINSFNQVIEFDSDENVWYFSDLWNGSPPMAPVNRGYTKNVKEVRDHLLKRFNQTKPRFLSISHKGTHVEDLWNGVLAQDFVFSFKNSLAAKAYNNLEKSYNEITMNTNCKISEWVNKEATVAMDRCTTGSDLDHQNGELCTTLSRMGGKLQEQACSALKEFFQSHELKDMLVEWENQKMKGLTDDIDRYIKSAKQTIQQGIESRKAQLRQKAKFADIHSEIMKRARHLANSMKGKMANEVELKNKFEDFWKNTVRELVPKGSKVLKPIENTVEDLLYKWLGKDGAFLREELQKRSLSNFDEIYKLENSFDIEEVDQKQLSISTSLYQKSKDFVKNRDRDATCRKRALESINNISKSVDVYLTKTYKKDSDFQESFAESVINTVIAGVEKENTILKKDNSFTLLPSLKVKIAVHACRHAVKVFNQMREKYQRKYDVIRQLEKKKQINWTLFQNLVRKCENEIIAADLLLGQLEIMVNHEVQKDMTLTVVNEVVRYFSNTKYALLVRILDDLAGSSFNESMEYAKNAKTFALKWITKFTNKLIFGARENEECTLFVQFADINIDKYKESITKKIKATTDSFQKAGGIHSWVKRFITLMTELPVTEQTLKGMMDQEVDDFNHLQALLMQRLPDMQKRILDDFKRQTSKSQSWEGETPYKQILEKLWGCEAQCPLCDEVCQRTDPNHLSPNDSHQCIQHRPGGIGGISYRRSDVLCVESCNFDVQSDKRFAFGNLPHLKDLEEMYHPFREYKKFLPDWDIAPSPNMESTKYWMWFMAKYKHELADRYDRKLPDIPAAWSLITKEEAVRSLREHYS